MKLEDLPLDESEPEPVDERTTDWYRFLEEIDDLQITHSFAQDTLTGIYESVEKSHRVTEGQRRAINNIASSRSKERGSYSRRYR